MARAIGSYPIGRGFKSNSRYGPLVKRLRHRPFTAVTWVRFPYGSPTKKDGFCLFLIKMNYEKQKQSGGKDEQFRLFVLFVLRKAL